MDHAANPLATSPTNEYPPKLQSSGTADPVEDTESSSLRFLTQAPSAPTHVNDTRRTRGPPHGRHSLPLHPTEHPKEKFPDGISVPSLEQMFKGLLQAPRPVGDAPSALDQLRNIATYSWLNLLLVLVPISWAAVSDFPLILAVSCKQAVSHCFSYSPGSTLLYTLWYYPYSHEAAPHTFLRPPSTRDFTDPCSPCPLCVALYQPQSHNCLCPLIPCHRSTGCAPRVSRRRTHHPRRTGCWRFAQCNVRKYC